MNTVDVASIASEINYDAVSGSGYDNIVDGADESWAANLVKELESRGWSVAESFSYCSVATFEQNLVKDGIGLNISVANLFGVYTNIKSYV